jgi:DNA-binding response OmpR family regulator
MILVVEDDEALRETILEVLKEFGYRAVGVATNEEAAQAFAAETPKLLLVDVQLAHETTRSFVQSVLANRPAPPVILVSGSSPAAAMARELGLPMVSKPFEMQHLIEMIDRALGRESRALAPTRRLRPFTGLP